MFDFICTYRIGNNRGPHQDVIPKRAPSRPERTMPLTSTAIFTFVALAGFCNLALAKSDSKCLKHLGGGYGDTQCYGDLSADLVKDSKRIYEKIRAKMPGGSSHAKLLDAYMASQDNALKFCELQRDAGTGWESNPDGSMYSALYAECVYDLRKSQNAFLSDLLKMSEW